MLYSSWQESFWDSVKYGHRDSGECDFMVWELMLRNEGELIGGLQSPQNGVKQGVPQRSS